ncbi:hypothetical protein LEQ41_11600, partial [Streptococcus agalactiae]|nr:hypothetical protein [Streptococcus agalactiae]
MPLLSLCPLLPVLFLLPPVLPLPPCPRSPRLPAPVLFPLRRPSPAPFPPAAPGRLWSLPAAFAFPCAPPPAFAAAAAPFFVAPGVLAVPAGAPLPSPLGALPVFPPAGVAFGPAPAAPAGGVAVSALALAPPSRRRAWPFAAVAPALPRLLPPLFVPASPRLLPLALVVPWFSVLPLPAFSPLLPLCLPPVLFPLFSSSFAPLWSPRLLSSRSVPLPAPPLVRAPFFFPPPPPWLVAPLCASPPLSRLLCLLLPFLCRSGRPLLGRLPRVLLLPVGLPPFVLFPPVFVAPSAPSAPAASCLSLVGCRRPPLSSPSASSRALPWPAPPSRCPLFPLPFVPPRSLLWPASCSPLGLALSPPLFFFFPLFFFVFPALPLVPPPAPPSGLLVPLRVCFWSLFCFSRRGVCWFALLSPRVPRCPLVSLFFCALSFPGCFLSLLLLFGFPCLLPSLVLPSFLVALPPVSSSCSLSPPFVSSFPSLFLVPSLFVSSLACSLFSPLFLPPCSRPSLPLSRASWLLAVWPFCRLPRPPPPLPRPCSLLCLLPPACFPPPLLSPLFPLSLVFLPRPLSSLCPCLAAPLFAGRPFVFGRLVRCVLSPALSPSFRRLVRSSPGCPACAAPRCLFPLVCCVRPPACPPSLSWPPRSLARFFAPLLVAPLCCGCLPASPSLAPPPASSCPFPRPSPFRFCSLFPARLRLVPPGLPLGPPCFFPRRPCPSFRCRGFPALLCLRLSAPRPSASAFPCARACPLRVFPPPLCLLLLVSRPAPLRSFPGALLAFFPPFCCFPFRPLLLACCRSLRPASPRLALFRLSFFGVFPACFRFLSPFLLFLLFPSAPVWAVFGPASAPAPVPPFVLSRPLFPRVRFPLSGLCLFPFSLPFAPPLSCFAASCGSAFVLFFLFASGAGAFPVPLRLSSAPFLPFLVPSCALLPLPCLPCFPGWFLLPPPCVRWPCSPLSPACPLLLSPFGFVCLPSFCASSLSASPCAAVPAFVPFPSGLFAVPVLSRAPCPSLPPLPWPPPWSAPPLAPLLAVPRLPPGPPFPLLFFFLSLSCPFLRLPFVFSSPFPSPSLSFLLPPPPRPSLFPLPPSAPSFFFAACSVFFRPLPVPLVLPVLFLALPPGCFSLVLPLPLPGVFFWRLLFPRPPPCSSPCPVFRSFCPASAVAPFAGPPAPSCCLSLPLLPRLCLSPLLPPFSPFLRLSRLLWSPAGPPGFLALVPSPPAPRVPSLSLPPLGPPPAPPFALFFAPCPVPVRRSSSRRAPSSPPVLRPFAPPLALAAFASSFRLLGSSARPRRLRCFLFSRASLVPPGCCLWRVLSSCVSRFGWPSRLPPLCLLSPVCCPLPVPRSRLFGLLASPCLLFPLVVFSSPSWSVFSVLARRSFSSSLPFRSFSPVLASSAAALPRFFSPSLFPRPPPALPPLPLLLVLGLPVVPRGPLLALWALPPLGGPALPGLGPLASRFFSFCSSFAFSSSLLFRAPVPSRFSRCASCPSSRGPLWCSRSSCLPCCPVSPAPFPVPCRFPPLAPFCFSLAVASASCAARGFLWLAFRSFLAWLFFASCSFCASRSRPRVSVLAAPSALPARVALFSPWLFFPLLLCPLFWAFCCWSLFFSSCLVLSSRLAVFLRSSLSPPRPFSRPRPLPRAPPVPLRFPLCPFLLVRFCRGSCPCLFPRRSWSARGLSWVSRFWPLPFRPFRSPFFCRPAGSLPLAGLALPASSPPALPPPLALFPARCSLSWARPFSSAFWRAWPGGPSCCPLWPALAFAPAPAFLAAPAPASLPPSLPVVVPFPAAPPRLALARAFARPLPFSFLLPPFPRSLLPPLLFSALCCPPPAALPPFLVAPRLSLSWLLLSFSCSLPVPLLGPAPSGLVLPPAVSPALASSPLSPAALALPPPPPPVFFLSFLSVLPGSPFFLRSPLCSPFLPLAPRSRPRPSSRAAGSSGPGLAGPLAFAPSVLLPGPWPSSLFSVPSSPLSPVFLCRLFFPPLLPVCALLLLLPPPSLCVLLLALLPVLLSLVFPLLWLCCPVFSPRFVPLVASPVFLVGSFLLLFPPAWPFAPGASLGLFRLRSFFPPSGAASAFLSPPPVPLAPLSGSVAALSSGPPLFLVLLPARRLRPLFPSSCSLPRSLWPPPFSLAFCCLCCRFLVLLVLCWCVWLVPCSLSRPLPLGPLLLFCPLFVFFPASWSACSRPSPFPSARAALGRVFAFFPAPLCPRLPPRVPLPPFPGPVSFAPVPFGSRAPPPLLPAFPSAAPPGPPVALVGPLAPVPAPCSFLAAFFCCSFRSSFPRCPPLPPAPSSRSCCFLAGSSRSLVVCGPSSRPLLFPRRPSVLLRFPPLLRPSVSLLFSCPSLPGLLLSLLPLCPCPLAPRPSSPCSRSFAPFSLPSLRCRPFLCCSPSRRVPSPALAPLLAGRPSFVLAPRFSRFPRRLAFGPARWASPCARPSCCFAVSPWFFCCSVSFSLRLRFPSPFSPALGRPLLLPFSFAFRFSALLALPRASAGFFWPPSFWRFWSLSPLPFRRFPSASPFAPAPAPVAPGSPLSAPLLGRLPPSARLLAPCRRPRSLSPSLLPSRSSRSSWRPSSLWFCSRPFSPCRPSSALCCLSSCRCPASLPPVPPLGLALPLCFSPLLLPLRPVWVLPPVPLPWRFRCVPLRPLLGLVSPLRCPPRLLLPLPPALSAPSPLCCCPRLCCFPAAPASSLARAWPPAGLPARLPCRRCRPAVPCPSSGPSSSRFCCCCRLRWSACSCFRSSPASAVLVLAVLLPVPPVLRLSPPSPLRPSLSPSSAPRPGRPCCSRPRSRCWCRCFFPPPSLSPPSSPGFALCPAAWPLSPSCLVLGPRPLLRRCPRVALCPPLRLAGPAAPLFAFFLLPPAPPSLPPFSPLSGAPLRPRRCRCGLPLSLCFFFAPPLPALGAPLALLGPAGRRSPSVPSLVAPVSPFPPSFSRPRCARSSCCLLFRRRCPPLCSSLSPPPALSRVFPLLAAPLAVSRLPLPFVPPSVLPSPRPLFSPSVLSVRAPLPPVPCLVLLLALFAVRARPSPLLPRVSSPPSSFRSSPSPFRPSSSLLPRLVPCFFRGLFRSPPPLLLLPLLAPFPLAVLGPFSRLPGPCFRFLRARSLPFCCSLCPAPAFFFPCRPCPPLPLLSSPLLLPWWPCCVVPPRGLPLPLLPSPFPGSPSWPGPSCPLCRPACSPSGCLRLFPSSPAAAAAFPGPSFPLVPPFSCVSPRSSCPRCRPLLLCLGSLLGCSCSSVLCSSGACARSVLPFPSFAPRSACRFPSFSAWSRPRLSPVFLPAFSRAAASPPPPPRALVLVFLSSLVWCLSFPAVSLCLLPCSPSLCPFPFRFPGLPLSFLSFLFFSRSRRFFSGFLFPSSGPRLVPRPRCPPRLVSARLLARFSCWVRPPSSLVLPPLLFLSPSCRPLPSCRGSSLPRLRSACSFVARPFCCLGLFRSPSSPLASPLASPSPPAVVWAPPLPLLLPLFVPFLLLLLPLWRPLCSPALFLAPPCSPLPLRVASLPPLVFVPLLFPFSALLVFPPSPCLCLLLSFLLLPAFLGLLPPPWLGALLWRGRPPLFPRLRFFRRGLRGCSSSPCFPPLVACCLPPPRFPPWVSPVSPLLLWSRSLFVVVLSALPCVAAASVVVFSPLSRPPRRCALPSALRPRRRCPPWPAPSPCSVFCSPCSSPLLGPRRCCPLLPAPRRLSLPLPPVPCPRLPALGPAAPPAAFSLSGVLPPAPAPAPCPLSWLAFAPLGPALSRLPPSSSAPRCRLLLVLPWFLRLRPGLPCFFWSSPSPSPLAPAAPFASGSSSRSFFGPVAAWAPLVVLSLPFPSFRFRSASAGLPCPRPPLSRRAGLPLCPAPSPPFPAWVRPSAPASPLCSSPSPPAFPPVGPCPRVLPLPCPPPSPRPPAFSSLPAAPSPLWLLCRPFAPPVLPVLLRWLRVPLFRPLLPSRPCGLRCSLGARFSSSCFPAPAFAAGSGAPRWPLLSCRCLRAPVSWARRSFPARSSFCLPSLLLPLLPPFFCSVSLSGPLPARSALSSPSGPALASGRLVASFWPPSPPASPRPSGPFARSGLPLVSALAAVLSFCLFPLWLRFLRSRCPAPCFFPSLPLFSSPAVLLAPWALLLVLLLRLSFLLPLLLVGLFPPCLPPPLAPVLAAAWGSRLPPPRFLGAGFFRGLALPPSLSPPCSLVPSLFRRVFSLLPRLPLSLSFRLSRRRSRRASALFRRPSLALLSSSSLSFPAPLPPLPAARPGLALVPPSSGSGGGACGLALSFPPVSPSPPALGACWSCPPSSGAPVLPLAPLLPPLCSSLSVAFSSFCRSCVPPSSFPPLLSRSRFLPLFCWSRFAFPFSLPALPGGRAPGPPSLLPWPGCSRSRACSGARFLFGPLSPPLPLLPPPPALSPAFPLAPLSGSPRLSPPPRPRSGSAPLFFPVPVPVLPPFCCLPARVPFPCGVLPSPPPSPLSPAPSFPRGWFWLAFSPPSRLLPLSVSPVALSGRGGLVLLPSPLPVAAPVRLSLPGGPPRSLLPPAPSLLAPLALLASGGLRPPFALVPVSCWVLPLLAFLAPFSPSLRVLLSLLFLPFSLLGPPLSACSCVPCLVPLPAFRPVPSLVWSLAGRPCSLLFFLCRPLSLPVPVSLSPSAVLRCFPCLLPLLPPLPAARFCPSPCFSSRFPGLCSCSCPFSSSAPAFSRLPLLLPVVLLALSSRLFLPLLGPLWPRLAPPLRLCLAFAF